jgi:hypothetical protein
MSVPFKRTFVCAILHHLWQEVYRAKSQANNTNGK